MGFQFEWKNLGSECFRYLGVDLAVIGIIGAEVSHRVDGGEGRGNIVECMEREVAILKGEDGYV